MFVLLAKMSMLADLQYIQKPTPFSTFLSTDEPSRDKAQVIGVLSDKPNGAGVYQISLAGPTDMRAPHYILAHVHTRTPTQAALSTPSMYDV